MRGIAMLHSFWFSAGEATFRAALTKDPTCAIAEWGICVADDEQPAQRRRLQRGVEAAEKDRRPWAHARGNGRADGSGNATTSRR